MILLSVVEGVPKYVVAEMQRFVPRIELFVDVPHRLPLLVVPAVVVTNPDSGQCGFGVFLAGRVRRPRIVVGGHKPPAKELPPADFLKCLRGTVAHELAHYEQWRDRRPMTERGVRVRARSLLRVCDEEGIV